jgi:hypothetical protein
LPPSRRRPSATTSTPSPVVLDPWLAILRQKKLVSRSVASVGELLELGYARGEFVRALGWQTNAWVDLVSRFRDLGPQEGETASFEERQVVDTWLRVHDLEVEWMREWATRAVVLIQDCFTQAGTNEVDRVHVDRVLLHDCGAPEPDTLRTLTALDAFQHNFGQWAGDEHPPNPAVETRTAFLERMKEAWDLRVSWLGSVPAKRAFTRHAKWYARVHVGRETVGDILAGEPNLERTTVDKALLSFPLFAELPSICA